MIYDCFLYYDEDMLLEIRLETLQHVVDRFVIVESTHSFTGNKKRLNFSPEKFKKFQDKITYVIFDEAPYDDPWQNEAQTRNAIMRGLKQASDNDLILVSDVDEIFNPDVISTISPTNFCTTIFQNFYNYQFNLQVFNTNGTARQCTLPRAVTYKRLKNFFLSQPELLRNFKKENSPIRKNWLKWNLLKLRNKKIMNGGWHFSWVMTVERISEKMSSISHTENDIPEFNNPVHIKKSLLEGKDIWGRERIMKVQELNECCFPDYLVKNKKKFRDFIL